MQVRVFYNYLALLADRICVYEKTDCKNNLQRVRQSLKIIVIYFAREAVLCYREHKFKRKMWSFTFTIKVMTISCNLVVKNSFSSRFVII